MLLATREDVKKRLGRDLTDEDVARVDGLIEEASAIVEGYLRRVFADDLTTDPPTPAVIPSSVVVVVSRMAARVLDSGDTDGAENQMTAGPYSFSRKPADNTGGPWLSKADKQTLAGARTSAVSVPMISERRQCL